MNNKFDIYKVEKGSPLKIPYIDEGIPAGFPSPAQNYVTDSVDLNDILITTPGSTYIARVKAYYLVEEELENGDWVIFDTSLRPKHKDLVLCVIDGEMQLKYIEKKEGIYLVSGATDDRIKMNEDSESYIIAVVSSIIKNRRYKGRRTLLHNKEIKVTHRKLSQPKRAIRWGYMPENDKDIKGCIDLNTEFIKNPLYTNFGRVKGFSLMDDDIDNDDSVIIDSSLEPNAGDLVVTYTDNGFTMKYIRKDSRGIWLMPGNKNYSPIHITEDNELLIWGIVTASIKQLRIKGWNK